MVILDPFQAFNTILLIKNYMKHQVVVSKDPLESRWYSRWKIKNKKTFNNLSDLQFICELNP